VKKYVFLYALLLLGLAGCGKKGGDSGRSFDKSGQALASTSARVSKYDDKIGAFVLEDDADFDIFGESPQSGDHQMQAEADQFVWQELEDVDQEEGHPVYFAYDSDEISPAELQKIKKNAKDAKVAISAGATVLVEGHSCLISHSEVYNTALSQRRAERVAQEYQKLRIPRKHMKVVGRGASKAVCFDDDKEAQSVNRRTETRLIYTERPER
jgi:outer membrane protein OmpA-like peptidoglycan-associated protein